MLFYNDISFFLFWIFNATACVHLIHAWWLRNQRAAIMLNSLSDFYILRCGLYNPIHTYIHTYVCMCVVARLQEICIISCGLCSCFCFRFRFFFTTALRFSAWFVLFLGSLCWCVCLPLSSASVWVKSLGSNKNNNNHNNKNIKQSGGKIKVTIIMMTMSRDLCQN